MTSAQIKRFLRSVNVSNSDAAAGVRIPELKLIISDKPQGVLFYDDLVTFDFDNELIEIKKYNHKAVNGLLNPLIGKNNELKLYSTSSLQKYLNYSYYRKPMIGDKVYNMINGNKQLLGIITDITDFKISLDRTISEGVYADLIYVGRKDIDNAIADFAVKNLFIEFTPVTSNKADIYMNFSGITGFAAFSSSNNYKGRV